MVPIAAGAMGGGGSSEVEPNDTPPMANPLAADGGPVVARIAPAGDTDWYCFSAVAGTPYTLTTSCPGGTALDTILYLYDTDGATEIGSDDDGGPGLYSALTWGPETSGTYYVRVVEYGSDWTGDYRLEISTTAGDAYEPDNSATQATPTTVDAPRQDHTLHVGSDCDWLSFDGSAGHAYVIETSQTADPATTDTEIWLYDSDLNILADNDDIDWTGNYYSRIEWTCPADGTYYVDVHASSGCAYYDLGTGPYSISITEGGTTVLQADDVSGNVGETVKLSATLTSGSAPPPAAASGVYSSAAVVVTGTPLAGKTVDFEVDGAAIGSGVTDDCGVATVSYTIPSMGDKTFTATFAGDPSYGPSSDDGAVTVYNSVTGIGLFLSAATIAAGETVTATVVDAGGNIITPACRVSIKTRAGGSWAGNVYTSQVAGAWTVAATYGPLSDQKPLTVTHAAADGVDISPDAATITTADRQTYTIQAADALGNTWTPELWDVTWTHDGAGTFVGADYVADDADAGATLDIHATVDGVDSDHVSLKVNPESGAGLVLAWDKDTYAFYLCANPADPQTGMQVPAVNGTHVVNGVTVVISGTTSNRTASVTNSAGIANTLQVRWYSRRGAVYQAYLYSTIAGTQKAAVYRSGSTFVDGDYRSGFWGLTHTLDAPDPAAIAYGAAQQ